MDIVPPDLYILGLWIGLLFQIVLGWLFRNRMAGLFDLFFLNLVYISFGLSGLILIFIATGSDYIANEIAMLAIWLIAMAWGGRLSFGSKPVHCLGLGVTSQQALTSVRTWDLSVFLIVAGMYVLYILQILSSGILTLDSSLIDSRFVVQQDNKIQGYLFSAVGLIPGGILFRLYPRLSFFSFIAAISPFWIVQALTLSKTGFLFPVIAGSLYFALRVKGGISPRPSMKKQVGAVIALAVVVYLIFLFIAVVVIDTETSPLIILMNRLFSSFDGLVYLSSINLNPNVDVSLFQWYLSPFLKVVGIFDQKYNAFNYLLAAEYFGQGDDYVGMLPNNNHIGELMVAYSPLLMYPAAVVSGVMYGSLFSWALRRVLIGGWALLPAAFIVATPFGFLVDGQGWCIALLCSCCLIPVAYCLRVLIGMFIRIRPRVFQAA